MFHRLHLSLTVLGKILNNSWRMRKLRAHQLTMELFQWWTQGSFPARASDEQCSLEFFTQRSSYRAVNWKSFFYSFRQRIAAKHNEKFIILCIMLINCVWKLLDYLSLVYDTTRLYHPSQQEKLLLRNIFYDKSFQNGFIKASSAKFLVLLAERRAPRVGKFIHILCDFWMKYGSRCTELGYLFWWHRNEISSR